MAVIIASTHFAYPRRDGQAELAWGQHVECRYMYNRVKIVRIRWDPLSFRVRVRAPALKPRDLDI